MEIIVAVSGLIVAGISLIAAGILIKNGIPALIGVILFGIGSSIGFVYGDDSQVRPSPGQSSDPPGCWPIICRPLYARGERRTIYGILLYYKM